MRPKNTVCHWRLDQFDFHTGCPSLVDTVNDLYIERLKPFDLKTAKKFVEAIFASREVKLTPKVKTTILQLIGVPIPYLLAVFLTAIFDRHRASGGSVTVAMVKAAFEEDLLGGATSAVFQHYRSRIDQYYPGLEGQAARAILSTLSRVEQPVRKDTLHQIYLKTCHLQPTQKHLDDFSRAARGRLQYLLEFFTTWYAAREEKNQSRRELVSKLDQSLETGTNGFHEQVQLAARNSLQSAFRTANVETIRKTLDIVLSRLSDAEALCAPYSAALAYLQSNRDPAVMERQHPEMREAMQLLVDLYDEGAA